MYPFVKAKVAIMKPATISLLHIPIPVCHIGPGKATEVADLLSMHNIKKALVVTDAVLMKLGLPAKMLKGMEERSIAYVVYDRVTPDPTYTIVEECLALCKAERCEAIVAIGGGSVLDTAKTTAVGYTNDRSPRAMEGMLKVKKPGLPVFAIPTTAGTGSEATVATVISDPKTHRKTTIIDPKICPGNAILDPELTVGLPAHITAQTALDALTHAVEAYVSGYARTETNDYARIAVKLIYESLERVYHNPDDLKGREHLLIASFYAGMAFTRTYVGYVHAFAHNIGARYGVAHGLGCAAVLPYVMEAYQGPCQRQFAELAVLTGVAQEGDSERMKSEKFIKSLFDLNERVGIPSRLHQFPRTGIQEVRAGAFKECHGLYPVPVYFSAAQADAILERVASAE